MVKVLKVLGVIWLIGFGFGLVSHFLGDRDEVSFLKNRLGAFKKVCGYYPETDEGIEFLCDAEIKSSCDKYNAIRTKPTKEDDLIIKPVCSRVKYKKIGESYELK